MENFKKTLDGLVEKLNVIEARKATEKGYTFRDTVHVPEKGKKFAYIDIGGSGAWLVERATGEIFNIKGYGVPDYNKKAKADIGNIATVDPEAMHLKRWNYLR